MGLNVHQAPYSTLPHDIKRYLWMATNRWERRKLAALRAGGHGDYSLQGFERTGGLFVHIPKAAGVSICTALFGNLGGGHTPMRKYQLIYSRRTFESLFKFTFVRNPWDRLYSAYSFLRRGGFDEQDQRWSETELSRYEDFEDFVLNGLARAETQAKVHFRPQVYFLRDDRGNMPLDFVGRFERINDDLSHIAQRLEVSLELQHLNKTSRPKAPYEDHFTPQMVDIAATVYAEDIRQFEYRFGE